MEESIYDLCIIGAGFFGSCAARHASANPGLRICLIGLDEPSAEELKEKEIFSSHYDEGRIFKAVFPSPAFQVLSRQSINRTRHLEKLSGIKFYNPVGFMSVGKKGNRLMRALEDVSSAVGTHLTYVDDTEFLKKKFPFLRFREDEYGLLDDTGAGVISCRKMLKAEKKISEEQGCDIYVDRVIDVEPLANGHHEIQTDRHGTIRSRRVLITTGAFTNVNRFKILPHLDISVWKEMAALVRIPNHEVGRLSSMPGMIYKRDEEGVGSYILPPVQYPDGHYYLKAGSMLYDSGEGMHTAKEIKHWFLSEEVPGETKSVSRHLFEALPGLTTEGLFRKICVTCVTPSDFPYIDRISPTVTVAVAGNGWGATIAEEVGRLAALLSLTGEWDSKLPKSLFEVVIKEE